MRRWIPAGLLVVVLLSGLLGCRGSKEPLRQTRPLPDNRFPQQR